MTDAAAAYLSRVILAALAAIVVRSVVRVAAQYERSVIFRLGSTSNGKFIA